MRGRAGVLAAVVCCLFSIVGEAFAAPVKPCKAEGRECLRVAVPLDRSGAVPGTVWLRVERHRAPRPVRPPLLQLTGLPGQSTTVTELESLPRAVRKLLPLAVRRDLNRVTRFEARERDIPYFLRGVSRSRDVVVMDLRGTGNSGALECPALQRASAAGGSSPIARAAAACAASLGARRGLFTARESAEDIEAVRQALGAERLALLGVSYGADVAFRYAQAHPDRVDRLVLDSVSSPAGFDGMYRQGLAAVPDAVQVLCRKRRCHRASPDPIGDFTRLARRLERRPLEGRIVGPAGRQRKARIEPFALFEALFQALDGDRNVVGYVRNALRGDVRPLLRYRHLSRPSFEEGWLSPKGFSVAAHAASRCEEAQLPWPHGTDVAVRFEAAAAFLDGLPSGAFGPFGPRTVLQGDVVQLCARWPFASASQPLPTTLPSIPTLIGVSVEDMRAPLAGARAVANLIPGSRLLRLRGAGHQVFGTSSCADQVLEKFLRGNMPADVCGPEWKSYRGAAPPPPLSLSELSPDRRVGGRAGRALHAINATIQDAFESGTTSGLLRSRGALPGRPRLSWGGLRRGRYTLDVGSWRVGFHGVAYVPGLRLSGWLAFASDRAKRRGELRLAGVVDGRLTVRRGMMEGRIAGRWVRAPLRLGSDFGVEGVAFSRTAMHRAP